MIFSPHHFVLHPKTQDESPFTLMSEDKSRERAAQIIRATEQTFDALVKLQQERLLKLAQELKPRMAPDDITDPQSFPEFANDTRFNYEEGYLQGLMAAQLEIRRAILRPISEGRRPGSA